MQLALANFIVGFGAFVVVAVLPLLADDLGVGEATAGWTLTVYAIVYAVGSPVGIALTGSFDRRNVLTGGLALFGAGALLTAVASSFEFVLGSRAIMALGGGVVTPVAASVAIGMISENGRGRALAIVFGGLTLAQALGVPVGAWLGYTFGWRGAFAASALLALPIALLLRFQLPGGLVVPVATLAKLGEVLRRPDLVAALALTVLFLGGVWTVYTFFTPLFEARLGLSGRGITLLLFVFGAGAVLGNALGGWLTDRIGARLTLIALALCQLVFMPTVTLFPFGASVIAVGFASATILAWSVASWSFMVPQQARLAALATELAPILLALNASAIYAAASIGSVLGGIALTGAGLGSLGVIGAALVLLGLVSLPFAERLTKTRRIS